MARWADVCREVPEFAERVLVGMMARSTKELDLLRDPRVEVVFTRINDAGDRLRIESWHPGRGIEVVERD